MKMIIYKYPLEWEADQWVSLPKGAKILSVQPQVVGFDRKLMLWALVDRDMQIIRQRRIILRGTGTDDEVNPKWDHLATCVLDSGYVWHIFEARLFD